MKRIAMRTLAMVLSIVMVLSLFVAPASAAVPMMGADAGVVESAGEAPAGGRSSRSVRGDAASLLADPVTTFTFEAKKLPEGAGTLIPADMWQATGDDYFTLSGSVNAKVVEGAIASVECAKNGGSGILFTVTGSATATIKFSSTSATNYSYMRVCKDNKSGAVQTPTLVAGPGNSFVATAQGNVGADGTTVLDKDRKYEAKEVIVYGNEAAATTVSYTLAAGTYFVTTGNNSLNRGGRIVSIVVEQTGALPEKVAQTWDKATIAPGSETSAAVSGSKVTLTTTNVKTEKELDQASGTYKRYADYAWVEMLDSKGNLVTEKALGANGKAEFTPADSDTYTFKTYAIRVGQGAGKLQVGETTCKFVYPLAVPALNPPSNEGSAVTGKGTVRISWSASHEATGYNLYINGEKINETPIAAIKYMYTADVGTELSIKVTAVRNGTGPDGGVEETNKSDAVTITPTQDKKVDWVKGDFGTNKGGGSFTVKGSGAEKTVQITASGNKFQTKLQGEGITFYYTAVPSDMNFTLKAKMTVNSWDENNSQVAFGLLAADYVISDATDYYSNEIFVGAAEVAKSAKKNAVFGGRVGIGAYYKHGGKDKKGTGLQYDCINMDRWVVNYGADEIDTTLTYYAAIGNKRTETDTTNVYGGERVLDESGNQVLNTKGFPKWTGITELNLILQRNNTGYFVSYVDDDGEYLNLQGKPVKIYDRDCLNVVDAGNIYVGLMAARAADVTFSNIELVTVDPEDDEPAEAIEYEMIEPSLVLNSATSTNHADYHAVFTSNLKGTLKWTMGSQKGTVRLDPLSDAPVTPDAMKNANAPKTIRADAHMTVKQGNNSLKLEFTPDPASTQGLADDQKLTTEDTIPITKVINWMVPYPDRNNLYVSNDFNQYGDGTRENPMSIYRAVTIVQPGQKIILLDGTYKMLSTLTLPLGMDGLPDAPVYLMADPGKEAVYEEGEDGEQVLVSEAIPAAHPVLDFQGKYAGLKILSDYWYIKGFDVANCNGTGVAVGGNNNIIDSVNIYRGNSSGLQISRITNADARYEFWPHDNLIYRCTAFLNRDGGQAAADGFAHKETCGPGNVFRDCVSAYNSDDGWDFYAKPAQGSIGEGTIDHCYSYRNAYIEPSVGATPVPGKGGGNGFKMGGDSVPTAHRTGHVVKNSFSFYNRNYGYTSNSGPDLALRNTVGYHNGGSNFNFHTGFSGDTHFTASGTISVEGGNDGFGNIKGQNASDYNNSTTHWNNGNSALTASVFASTTFVDPINTAENTVKRDADGFVDFGDFLTEASNSGVHDIFPNPEDVDTAGYNPFELTMDELDEALTTVVEDKIESNKKPTGTNPDRDTSGRGESAATDTTAPGTETGTETGTDASTGTETATPTIDSVEAVKTETKVDNEGTKITTTEMSNGSTVETKVTMDGDVAVEVTDAEGEKIVDIEVPAEVAPAETKFGDVAEDHWAAEAIDRMASLGLVRGTGDDHYSPDGEVTRATLATMLFRFAGGKEGKENKFADAQGHWAADAIAWANAAGVVNGVSATEFAPDQEITREQMAVMLLRFAKLIGMDTSVDTGAAMGGYTDNNSVNGWAAEGMAWCVKNGIINGTSTTTLSPRNSATRAQTAVMLDRFIGLLK